MTSTLHVAVAGNHLTAHREALDVEARTELDTVELDLRGFSVRQGPRRGQDRRRGGGTATVGSPWGCPRNSRRDSR
jgi:hypothetical protein